MAEHIDKESGDTIITEYNQDRAFWGLPAWVAIWDSYDGAPIERDGTGTSCPIGTGRTEQEAIEDLLEQGD